MLYRSFARLVMLAAFALWAQAPPARAMLLVTAPAVHTSATGAHPHAHRSPHRHARHHRAVRAQLVPRGVPEAPAPRPRTPRRAEHRAALPSTPRERRHPQGPRFGAAMLAPVTRAPAPAGVGAVDQRQAPLPGGREGRVISGRGPPRVDPSSSLPLAPPAGPADPSGCLAARSRIPPAPLAARRAAAARSQSAPVASSLFTPLEPASGRSHVRRPEGAAAACPLPPSTGDLR